MGKPDAPKPLDPVATGAAQTATNIGTAIANQSLRNVNQVTPNGNLTFDQTGTHSYTDPSSGQTHDIPTYTATQTLSPQQQAISDQNSRAGLNLATLGADQSGRLNTLLSRSQDTSTLPDRGQLPTEGPNITTEIADAGDITRTYGTDFSDDRQKVEDALLSRINPQLERDRDALESRLASQGIRLGSEAYNSALEDHSRRVNDARFGAVLNAGQEQSRLSALEAARAGFENNAQSQAFQQNAARAGFQNTAEVGQTNAGIALANAQNAARGQAVSEDFAIRNQPINEITALMSGAQVQSPNFITPSTAQIPTTDIAGIHMGAFNTQNQAYQQQLAQRNSLLGGGLGLISNLLY